MLAALLTQAEAGMGLVLGECEGLGAGHLGAEALVPVEEAAVEAGALHVDELLLV
jgi:hypothetical protein